MARRPAGREAQSRRRLESRRVSLRLLVIWRRLAKLCRIPAFPKPRERQTSTAPSKGRMTAYRKAFARVADAACSWAVERERQGDLVGWLAYRSAGVDPIFSIMSTIA